jgi:tripeptidyl-peptidase-2
MSKQVEPAGNKITGVTGKVLTVPSSWCESSIDGKFRIGSKRAFGLYPKPLRDRMSRERLEKLWDPGHKVNLAKTTSEIQVFEAAKSGTGDALTGVDKLAKDNLDAGLDLLTQLDKKMRTNNGLGSTNGLEADIGPTFDVVSFHDGQHWNVIIDNTPDGDLENALKLRPFTETRDFAPLTKSDNLNVSVNVYDDGEVVQIVSISGSHGTHVSSIAVANFPDAPEKNGLAPGAQIVSVTIGDGRLSSMETGTALVRAMAYIMQRMEEGLKIDLINMSYGEHSHWSNAGKVGDMMAEIINKYGVTWVASAGNDGPALCTVGTPPDINTNTVIGVGAYVSPEMMVAMYSSREKLPAAPYTWTSRGPTIDGDRGVTICAPGGAITSVPAFTLRGSQLMNGTSMASPHTCGAISLLISGLRQRGLDHTPFSIKRSLAASAKALPHLCHYAQGHGLLQIEAAFEHLNKYVQSVDRDVRFSVSCNTGSSASKGIHLRDFDVDKPVEVAIKIEPFFLDPDNRQAQDKINFNMKFALGCTATWVKHPSHLDLMYTVRHFLVQVDPTGLDKGVHTTYINAYDANQPDKGPLFEIPITVVKPEPLVQLPRPHVQYKEIVFNPGTIKRTFVKVPDQATWAVVRVHSNETAATGKFVLHTVLLLPKKVVKTYENHKMFTLAENGEWTYAFPIEGNF